MAAVHQLPIAVGNLDLGRSGLITNWTESINRFPIDVYGNAGTFVFLLLLPFMLTVTVPACTLLNSFDLRLIAAMLAIATLFFAGARAVLHAALRSYSSASS